MKKLVEKFNALGDETRFKLFLLLSEKQICMNGLAKVLDISKSDVSQHLKLLSHSGLIKGERIGDYVHYNVQKNVIEELQGIINELSKDVVDFSEQKKILDIDSIDCTEVCKKDS